MTQISQAQLDANRRNAQKGTGPRTVQGKERSRFNAVKHGLTARIAVLPGEDPALFHAKVAGYKTDLQPRGTLENDLVEQMAQQSWQLDRALNADAARVAISIQTTAAETAVREAEQAAALGQRLFFDRRGPLPLYPCGKLVGRNSVRTSRVDEPDDPDDPVRLLIYLESDSAGCRLLLNHWAALRNLLETGQFWQSPDKLRAIRLLGRQPLDAADDRDVADVFLASNVLDPGHKQAFSELRSELDEDEWKAYSRRLEGRTQTAIPPEDAPAARAILLGVVDKATRRLNLLAAAHQERDAKLTALNPQALAFDATPESERLRRYTNACDRALHRTIATFLKVRKEVDIPEFDTTGSEDAGYQGDSGQWSVVTGQTQTDETSQAEPTAGGNGELRNEPAAGDTNHLLPEPKDDDSQGVWEYSPEEVHDLQNEPIGADFTDREDEPAAGVVDPMAEVDAAYREAMDAAVACIRDPEGAGSQGINMDRLKEKIMANAMDRVRADDLEEARHEFYSRTGKHREDGKHLTVAPARHGDPRSAGGNPRHRRDRRKRNKLNNERRV